jgi:hypothetical protein
MSPADERAGSFRRAFFHHPPRRSAAALTVDEAWRHDEANERRGPVTCLSLAPVSTSLVESVSDGTYAGAIVCPPHRKQAVSGLSMPPSRLIPGGALKRPGTMRPVASRCSTSAAAAPCYAKTARRRLLPTAPVRPAIGAPEMCISASQGRRRRDAAA